MANRATKSGLNDVINTLVKLALSSKVTDAVSTFPALDPNSIPNDLPSNNGVIVTVSPLNLPWQFGDTMAGDTGDITQDTSALHVVCDLKVTLWLRMQTDPFGRAKKIIAAIGDKTGDVGQTRVIGIVFDSDPDGQGYLTKLLAVFFDADPLGPDNTTLILAEPLQYVDTMMPKESAAKIGAWFPFSLMFKMSFVWDLGLSLSDG